MVNNARAALVTGASSGIGEAFARALAAGSTDLLLTSLPADRDRLVQMAEELATRYDIRCEVVTLDLSETGGPSRLQEAADAIGFEPEMLVNSAGYGSTGRFATAPLDDQLGIIQLNVHALVALTGLYLPRMVAKHRGWIINISSTAALAPVPYYAVYAASKAFVLNFTEALWAEYRREGIRIVAVCPGPVRTRFHERMAASSPSRSLSPTVVVAAAFTALDRDHPSVVRRVMPLGILAALFSAPIAPRRLRLIVAERLARWLDRPV